MKVIRLLILFLIVAPFSYGQGGIYKSLEQCKDDTIAYVKYNFGTNKARYVGKSMKFLMDGMDMQLMTNCFFPSDTGPYVTEDHEGKIEGFYFCYLQAFEVRNYRADKKLYYFVYFLFKVPPYTHNDEEFWILRREYEDDYCWEERFYNLFKDYVIDDVILFPMIGK